MKVVYIYDEFTNEFLGEQICQKNPIEGGYLLPKFYLNDKPNLSDTTTPYAKNGSWVYKNKIKVCYEYDVSSKKYKRSKSFSYDIKTDGYNIPANFTDIEPVDKDYSIWNSSTNSWDIDSAKKTADKWSAVRSKRNGLLYDCDFVMLSDVPITNSAKDSFVTYRQTLRDITKAATPDAVVWPDKPQYVKK